MSDETRCVLSEESVGTVVRVQERSPSSAQYRVQTQTDCTILVTTARFPEFYRGDVLAISGETEPLSEFNEQYAGYAEYLQRQGIDATARFADISLQEAGQKKLLDTIGAALRRQFVRVLQEPEASVVIAMTLGDRGMIPENITELFQRTGLSHILAISGLHLSIVAGLLMSMSRLLPIKSFPRTIFVLIALWAYVAFVSFPISAQRAALFWTLLLLAFQLRALVSFWSVLIITGTALVSLQPQIVLDVSFQLSFAAVAGIGLGLFVVRGARSHVRVYQVLAVPIGAAAATWPIISYHFGLVSPITVAVNILAMPAVPLLVVLSLLGAAVGTIASIIGTTIGVIVHGLWRWVEMVATAGAAIPGAAFEYTVPAWIAFAWYIILVVAAALLLKHQGRTWREIWA